MKSRYSQRLIEIIAWTAFLFFPFFLFPTVQAHISLGLLNPALTGILITHSLLIIYYYINFYFAVPKFYFAGKNRTYMIFLACCLLILTTLLLSQPGFNPFPQPPFRFPITTFVLSILIRFMMVTIFSLGIANMQRLKSIEKEKMQTELANLKAQINPHFLFNTLNSLYALSVKKSDLAPRAITRLSSIMRYVVTEAAMEKVSLEKEIAYLQSYVELERLRLTEKVNLRFAVHGETGNWHIAPLLFLPFVENVFKHGVSTSESSEITIEINIGDNAVQLRTENTKHRNINSVSALGLENVRRRLSLLYPGRHSLEINEDDSTYKTKLRIELNA